MSNYYVKYLEHNIATTLTDLAEIANKDDLYASGNFSDGGLFTKVKRDGTHLWTNRYRDVSGLRSIFRKVIEADNGDFILYGTNRVSTNSNRNLVVRVTPTGAVLWAKSYHMAKTRFNFGIAKTPNDTYVMTSWLNQTGSTDDIEVTRINGAGQVLNAASFGTSSGDDQVNGIIADGNDVVLFGTTSSGTGWDCFLMKLDSNLNMVWKHMIGDSNFNEIRSVVPLGNNSYACTGETTNNRHSFLFTFSLTGISFPVKYYDLLPGVVEVGNKTLIRVGSDWYLTAEENGNTHTTVTKFNSAYDILWHKRIDLGTDRYQLEDIQWHPQDASSIRIAGWRRDTVSDAMIMTTDLDFTSCVTTSLNIPVRQSTSFSKNTWNAVRTVITPTVTNISMEVTNIAATEEVICSPTGLDLSGAYFQSPYVYMQAAGSDSSDDSVFGFHLRWTLRRALGDKHIPKGNLSGPSGAYPSTLNFNRDDDFVRVYRGRYVEDHWTEINLQSPPSTILESGAIRRWSYHNIPPQNGISGVFNSVQIDFLSTAAYDQARSGNNPFTNPATIISGYTGIVEVKVLGKLSFISEVYLGTSYQGGSGAVRFETVSQVDQLDPDSIHVSCRKPISGLTPGDVVRSVCEHIQRIRFDYTGVTPTRIRFITYEDYLTGRDANDPTFWQLQGQHGLSLDNNQVYKQLEDSSQYTVHNLWRKFNEPSPGGEFRVNVDNYRNRWQMADGLKSGVTRYLQLSVTDPLANDTIMNNDPQTNDSQMEVSYLDLLNMVGADFHTARMLGLGTIDAFPPTAPPDRHVFLMEYITEASLEGEPAAFVRHLYMTPPLSVSDYKYPPAPELDPVTYGLSLDNKTGNPTAITDANGYTPHADIRFVNLSKQIFRYEYPMESFFASPEPFCLCDESLPVAFGVEYADGGVGTGSWERPEILNDSDYNDPGNLPEVMPLSESGTNPIFIHQETNQGIHHYGMYSINWFSRVSPVGNEVATNYTQFPKRSYLLPPLNLAAQLIQTEAPLILTTGAEQAMLSAIGGTDKTLMRVTFDWNHVHNMAHQFADKVQLFFRTSPPQEVKGKISSGGGAVSVNSVNHTVTVQTIGYTITSTNPAQPVNPVLPLADKNKFLGSVLVSNGKAFVIEDINTTTGGNNPTFILKQIRNTHLQEVPPNSNEFCITETWDSPNPGEMFIVYENVNDPATWNQVLTKQINVTNFSPTYTETVNYPDGTSEVKQIGGLVDAVNVAHIFDPDPTLPANTPTGVYTVTFSTQSLGTHPDTDVEYHGGILRVRDAVNEVRDLPVWGIDDGGSTLVLTVYDANYLNDPIIPNNVANQNLGTANFHPSYRAYFKVNGNFNDANTLPGFGEGTRETYIAARSRDTSKNCDSFISTPVVLLAREIREPVPPGIPTGPVFATRPNFYGKASYTFDVEVDQPYSLIFYKANERKILDTLYDTATVQNILSSLAALTSPDADFFQDRWNDLVNMNLDGSNLFKEYTAGGFRFPMPNNPNYIIPHPVPTVQESPFDHNLTFNDTYSYFDPITSTTITSTLIEITKDAIDGAFLPLSELPLVYDQVNDDEFVTYDRKPKIRDENGQKLLPSDSRYDPWPMAIKYEKSGSSILQFPDSGYGNAANDRFVRFTDYTLDGAAQNFYFYFGVELSNTLKVSDRSPVLGPIQLVNSSPAKSPGIRKVESIVGSIARRTGPTVVLKLNPFVGGENIRKFEIYRTTSAAKALSVRSMDLARTIDVGDELVDDFRDVAFPPYGEALFYRLVALREIQNEQGNSELVPSEASNTALANIVDHLYPNPPELTISHNPPTPPPVTLPNVSFSWSKTAHNATYYLYKLNASGTWTKIYSMPPSIHNNTNTMGVTLLATDLNVSFLEKEDADGGTIYHRFRVDVDNSSGLGNLDFLEETV